MSDGDAVNELARLVDGCNEVPQMINSKSNGTIRVEK
jgi:hypothetical protein